MSNVCPSVHPFVGWPIVRTRVYSRTEIRYGHDDSQEDRNSKSTTLLQRHPPAVINNVRIIIRWCACRYCASNCSSNRLVEEGVTRNNAEVTAELDPALPLQAAAVTN